MTTTRRVAPLATALLILGGCGDGRSLPGERSTSADSAISGGLRGAGPSGSLSLCAADGLEDVARRQTGAFMRVYSEAEMRVSTATARECIAELAAGRAGAALVDRPPNEEERAALRANGLSFTEVRIGTGALAVVTARSSPVRAIAPAAFGRLVAGEPVPWEDLADSAEASVAGSARLALAPRNAGAVELLTERFLSPGSLPRPAHPAADEAEVIAWVAATAGGLGVVSLATLRADTTSRVRALALPDSTGRPTLPSQRSLADGRYPLPQPLVLIVVGGRGPLAPSFATFALGTPGQEAVLRAGLLPAVRPVREIVLD